jgi:hypothetical protein
MHWSSRVQILFGFEDMSILDEKLFIRNLVNKNWSYKTATEYENGAKIEPFSERPLHFGLTCIQIYDNPVTRT